MPVPQALLSRCPIFRGQTFRSLTVGAVLLGCTGAGAAALDDVGYTQLQTELGVATPDGAGVPVTQVEADALAGAGIAYMPDPNHVDFTGKSITDASGVSTAFSGHATAVGRLFYGNTLSSTPGITTITGYLAEDWLTSGYLNFQVGGPNEPQPNTSASRIANHSWIGGSGSAAVDSNLLRRTDWLVDRDEFLQVVGYTGSASNPLLSSAYNVIAVNRTGAPTTSGSAAVDGTYTGGRTRPDLVAPAGSTSNAAPIVASATALLIDTAQSNPSLSTDPVVTFTTNRNGDTIYNASRSEVLKAVLMAGADRSTDNSADSDISNYRVNLADQTTNGLDRRYGAGQLNVYNSYHAIAAGEQNSAEDDNGGAIGATGFDYDPSFGGDNESNATGTYFFATGAEAGDFTASLAWNIGIDGGDELDFDGTATLYDMNLFLYDITEPDNWLLVASSESTIDNTENIWLTLGADRQYALQVKAAVSEIYPVFEWDYGLAWRNTVAPIPVPAAAWFLGSALGLLGLIRRRRQPGHSIS